jgi:hypothetical protein
MFGNDAIIPPRRNASSQSRGSPSRAKIVMKKQKTSEKK